MPDKNSSRKVIISPGLYIDYDVIDDRWSRICDLSIGHFCTSV